jgi:hypothetical protein
MLDDELVTVLDAGDKDDVGGREVDVSRKGRLDGTREVDREPLEEARENEEIPVCGTVVLDNELMGVFEEEAAELDSELVAAVRLEEDTRDDEEAGVGAAEELEDEPCGASHVLNRFWQPVPQ